MNLKDSVRALEAKGVTVALNVGAHEQCRLDSNCPLAIQLRRLMADASVTLEQLLEGYEEVVAVDPVTYDFPELSARMQVNIGGKTIDLNLDEVLTTQVRVRVQDKMRELAELQTRVKLVGQSLYNSYLNEIARQRDNRTLPQLTYAVEDMISTQCIITCEGGNYVFLFPTEYSPQYIIDSGIRYSLATEDKERMVRAAWLKIVVSPANKILHVLLMDEVGIKLQHYHGNPRDDCWGAVTIPKTWDKRLVTLQRLAIAMMNSLKTINRNSIFRNEPTDMPNIDFVMDRSTEIGREGEFDETRPAPVEEEHPAGWGAGHWGRRARQPGEQPPTVTDRRFLDMTPGDMDAVCTVCGAVYGRHYTSDAHGLECPEDYHRRLRNA